MLVKLLTLQVLISILVNPEHPQNIPPTPERLSVLNAVTSILVRFEHSLNMLIVVATFSVLRYVPSNSLMRVDANMLFNDVKSLYSANDVSNVTLPVKSSRSVVYQGQLLDDEAAVGK